MYNLTSPSAVILWTCRLLVDVELSHISTEKAISNKNNACLNIRHILIIIMNTTSFCVCVMTNL